jgi:hypothetical protein
MLGPVMLSAKMPARSPARPSPRRKRPTRTRKHKTATLLGRLTAEESAKVLSILLSRHQALGAEAEQVAAELVSMPAVDRVAHDVQGSLADIDCEAVTSRAGDQRWGHVAPTEAAWELLQLALGDVIRDMQRRMELGLVDAAEAICRGIVIGLHRAQGSCTDGALGWAPDFPSKQASRFPPAVADEPGPAAQRVRPERGQDRAGRRYLSPGHHGSIRSNSRAIRAQTPTPRNCRAREQTPGATQCAPCLHGTRA